MLVCAEGPSGAGKTTLLNKLSQDGGILLPTVDHYMGGFIISERTKDLPGNFTHYLEGEKCVSDHILKSNDIVFQDRNWLSQLTYIMTIEHFIPHVSFHRHKVAVAKALEESELLFPDFWILIECPPCLTAKRRERRGASKWGDVPKWISRRDKNAFRIKRHDNYMRFIRIFSPSLVEAENHSFGLIYTYNTFARLYKGTSRMKSKIIRNIYNGSL